MLDRSECNLHVCLQVEQAKSMSADQLANTLAIPVVLARERFACSRFESISGESSPSRLIAAETQGFLCRDDSIEGLRFYPNLFEQNTMF